MLLACAVAVACVACSTNSPNSGGSLPTAPAIPTSGASGGVASAEEQIAANWTAFFNASTPVTKRVALLEDGQTFAAIIQAQAGSTLESEASASVTQVALTSNQQATVNYSILLDGEPALPDQRGISVLQGGVWKVGVGSFCGLLLLENGNSTKGMPQACLNLTPTPTPSS